MTASETTHRRDSAAWPDNGTRHALGDADAPPVLAPGRRRGRTPPVAPAALGLVAATLALLAGGWLMYAPFAFGYQDFTLSWTDPTTTDFYTGLGLAVLALLGLAATAVALIGALRARGALTPRQRNRRVTGPDPSSDERPDELTALLRPLVEALNRDVAHERDADSPPRPAADPQT